MDTHFSFLSITRTNVLNVLEPYDPEQLNKIPNGFNNNLVWNLGHILVTQQLLQYRLSGLDVRINPDLIDKYRKGSRPEGRAGEEEIEYLRRMLVETVDQMKEDYASGLFQSYKPYTTSYHVTLNSVEDAIVFNNLHEAMHLGYMLGLRKSL